MKPDRRHPRYHVVLDVGTTTVRAVAFDDAHRVIAKAGGKLRKSFPRRGWVEQDPREIVRLTEKALADLLRDSRLDPRDCRGLGLTNQRETVILWDARDGRPICPAIVWEDVRTAAWCRRLRGEHGDEVRRLTGLAVDPYFSATKLTWALAHVPAARRLLEKGRLRFGTVDSWLVWNLAAGHPHVTDETNAHRTLLVDAAKRSWSPRLLEIFGVPASILPRILPSRASFGRLRPDLAAGAAWPIVAVCGDQQASLYAAWRELGGTHPTKITYGTGTFVNQVLGRRFAVREPFFTTLVPAPNGGSAYALEGKIARGGRQVEPLLHDPPRLRRFLRRLALAADAYVRLLPRRPRVIAIDGGVSRDGIVGAYQEAVSKTKIAPLPIFDGTALGVSYLVKDSVRKKKVKSKRQKTAHGSLLSTSLPTPKSL